MKKAYIRPAMDIINVRLQPLMDFSLPGGGNGTGKTPQSRYVNKVWEDDEEDEEDW